MHFLVAFRLDGCCSQYLLLMIVDIDLDLWKYIDIDIGSISQDDVTLLAVSLHSILYLDLKGLN